MQGRFAFACLFALAAAKKGEPEHSSGVTQTLNLIDDDGYKLDMTYATIRETIEGDDDQKIENTYLTIGLTGQNIASTGSYLGIAFQNPQTTKTETSTDSNGNTTSTTVNVALKWDGIYCTVADPQPAYPGLSNNLWSDSDMQSMVLSSDNSASDQAWFRDTLVDKKGEEMNCNPNKKGTVCEATTCVMRRLLPSQYDSSDITFTEGQPLNVVGFINVMNKDDQMETMWGETKSMTVLSGAVQLVAAASAAMLATLAF